VKLFGHIEEVCPPLTFSSIVVDGDRLNAAMKGLMSGQSVQELAKVYKGHSGERLLARAVKLNDKLANKLAYWGRRSAGKLGFIKKVRVPDTEGYKIVLTDKGHDSMASYTKWAASYFPKDQVSGFILKYKKKLLQNAFFWVRTDVRQKKENERDYGMELFADLIKPFQANDYHATISVAKNFLYAIESDVELKAAVMDLEAIVDSIFPIVNDSVADELANLNEVEEGMLSLDYDDEEEGDLVERYCGGAVLSQNAIIRDQFLSQLRKASKSKMNMQTLWDYTLRGMVDHYSNRVYGSNATGYDLGPTEQELEVIRDAFPYDNSVSQETYHTNIRKMEEDKIVGRDTEGMLVCETVEREQRESRVSYYNHDSGIESALKRVDDFREWRKAMTMALLAIPVAKPVIEDVQLRHLTLATHFGIKLEAMYIKECKEKGLEPDSEGLERYKARMYEDYLVA
jgi:hypothetical protein